MRISWKLRMAAAQRQVWTGTQLRRLLAERVGLELSSASVSALLTKEPGRVITTVVRREALIVRVEVGVLRRSAVVAVG